MKKEVFWKNPYYKIRPPLKKDIVCDYLIVGGGITGVSTAYFLAKERAKKIVLIEKNHIASGATGRAAGVLVPGLDEIDFKDVIRIYGKKSGLIFWYKVLDGFHQMRKIISKENIDCDFEKEDVIYAEFRYKTFNKVLDEYKIEKKLHFQVKLLLKEDLEKEVHTELFKEGILLHRGFSINPLKYTQNLSKVIEKYGVRVYENTPIIKIQGNKATTPNRTITFKKIVIATDVDSGNTEVKPIKSTIVITKKLTPQQLEKIGLTHKKILYDSKFDYDYFKLTKDNRLLVGLGGLSLGKYDNRTMLYRPHLKKIKSFIRRLFPNLKIEVEYAWSGSFGLAKNSMPQIVVNGDKIVVSGNGTQPTSTMMARYAANKLFNRISSLDYFFR